MRSKSVFERGAGFCTAQGVWSRDRSEYLGAVSEGVRRSRLVSTAISQTPRCGAVWLAAAMCPVPASLPAGCVPSQQLAPSEDARRSTFIELYPVDVRIRRVNWHMRSRASPSSARGAVDAFSDKSRARLRFTAANAAQPFISQFCLTYHAEYGVGADVKADLNRFLTWFRKHFRCIKYLWVLEFQTRGFPHFHLFLSCAPDRVMGLRMAHAWSRIAGRGSRHHRRFHAKKKNFIAWKMDTASYLTKYIDKTAQKHVPDSFGWVGRFWGSSRAVVAPPLYVDERFYDRRELARLVRGIGRWHEARLRKHGRRSFVRRSHNSRLVPSGAAVLVRLLE